MTGYLDIFKYFAGVRCCQKHQVRQISLIGAIKSSIFYTHFFLFGVTRMLEFIQMLSDEGRIQKPYTPILKGEMKITN